MTDPLDRFTSRLGEALVAEARARSAEAPDATPSAAGGARRPGDRVPGPLAGHRRAAPPHATRGRWIGRTGAVALAVVLVALAVGALVRGGTPTAAPGIGPTLAAAARNVDGAPGPAGLPAGRFYYTRIEVVFRRALDPAGGGRPVVYDQWAARDGSGLLDATPGRRTRVRATARPFTIGTDAVAYRTLASLPTDPDALARRLRTLASNLPDAAGVTPQVLVLSVVRGLAEAPTPTPVRAALLRVLADTPGVRFRRDARDHTGRPGVSLSADSDGLRFTVIVDSADGAILETSRVLLRRSDAAEGYRPGLLNRATFLRSAVTAKAGELP